jgi:maltose alpha-D-glucosyltransferase/alpha-amylase
MQWNTGKNLGFSTAAAGKLYLPVDTASDAPNVEAAEKDSNSLLNRTRRLIKLKHTEPALADYAEFIPLFAKENTYPFVYARAKDKDVVLVILNPSGKESNAEFELNIEFTKTSVLAGKEVKLNKAGKKISLTIPGQTYSIVKLE